jgi:ribonuclease I
MKDLSRAERFRRLQELVERPALMRRWTKDEVITELKKVSAFLGHSPTVTEFDLYAPLSYRTAADSFGSWNQALAAAGLKVRYVSSYTKAECLGELQRVAKDLGRTPRGREFDERAKMSYATLAAMFGTWNKGLKAAGLEVLYNKEWTKAECIRELRRVAKDLSETPQQRIFAKHSRISISALRNLFGSYNAALKAAGLSVNWRVDYTKSECLPELKRVARRLGRTPTITEFNREAKMSSNTIAALFGSWNKGLQAARLHVTRRSKQTPAYWTEKAKELTAANGGTLHSTKWLNSHGYGQLVTCMWKHPRLFPMKRTRRNRNVDYWVTKAEALAKENGGYLPSRLWLKRHGRLPLYQCLMKHPDAFRHIKRTRAIVIKTPGEWLQVAKRLIKENGGLLPGTAWLKQKGFEALTGCISRHPRVFAGIKQEPPGHRRMAQRQAKHLATATALAKRNGGRLPCIMELGNLGYDGLNQYIRLYPEVFRHLNQENKKGKSVQKWVIDAEKMARKNGGILPYRKSLEKRGLYGLRDALLKHPEAFKHIKQENRKGRNTREWVIEAERLAKKHGGVLPGSGYLQYNGYSGLSHHILRHPAAFRHIPWLRHGKVSHS